MRTCIHSHFMRSRQPACKMILAEAGQTMDVTWQIALLIGFSSLVFWFFLKRQKKFLTADKKVPGLEPSDSKLGNLAEIERAGSLHEFLDDLHTKFGPVASFWMENVRVVSTASLETFKPQIGLFNRPYSLFKNFEPLIGGESIQFQNYGKGKAIRKALDTSFSYEACSEYLPIFTEAADETAQKWKSLPNGMSVELVKDMLELALKSILKSSFGDYFWTDETCAKFKQNYDSAFRALDKLEGNPNLGEEFNKSRKKMRDQIRAIVEQRRENPGGQELLIDIIINISQNEEQIMDLALTYVIGGYHTTGTAMAWLLYYISKNSEIQEKMYAELKDVLEQGPIYGEACSSLLKYSRNVIDETLRLSQIGPYAARYSEDDLKIENFTIPKRTPIIQAVGVANINEEIWNEPNKFDPSRFENENVKNDFRCPFFGFAGKRKCPAYRLSYFEILAFLSVLVPQFKFTLADENFEARKSFGLVCHPTDEILIFANLRD